MRYQVKYKPTEIQDKYLRCPADEILYGGALGCGKSFAAVLEAYIECLRVPGLVVGLFRKSLPELEATLIREALRVFPQGSYVYKSAKRRIYFKNGSEIRFNYIDTDKDLAQYHGTEFDMIIMDEAGNFTEYQLVMIKERVRTSKPGVKTKIRYLTNPRGPGKGYLKRRFIDNKEPFKLYVTPETEDLPKEQQRYLCYIPARIEQNEHLYKNDPAYISSLKEMSEEEYKALVLGDWESKLGAYFTNFDKKNHVINDFDIDHDHDQLFISCDWGTAKPFAVYWGALRFNKIYIYREYYGATKPDVGLNMPAREVAKRILDLCPNNEDYKYMVLDSACWAKNGHTKSIYEHIQDILAVKRIPVIKSYKDRVQNFENMKQWMEPGIDGRPDLLIHKSCRNLIRTLPDMVFAKNGIDMDSSLEDHACDSVAYLLASRPPKQHKKKPMYNKQQWGYYFDDRYN